MFNLVTFSVLSVMIFIYCDAARVLGVVPTPSYSHQVAFQPLWRELALRGHKLTVLTTDPIKDSTLTTLTEIDLHFAYEPWNESFGKAIADGRTNPLAVINVFFSTLSNVTDLQLQHPEVQKLIKNEKEHFDLLMVEFLFPTMFAFSERFKCPFIAMTSLDAPTGVYELMGNPAHPIINPDFTLPFMGKLTFFERVISVLYKVFAKHYYNRILLSEQLTIEKHFGKGYPPLEEIQNNISMLFVNTDPIFHQVRPLVPAVIQFGGGTHIKSSKPLPKELKKFLDNASQGFIYFSLGSNVKSKDLSENVRAILLETFAELPYKVLWKFELDDLPGKSKNVISKWFSQQDIFENPHIKLFITQGGLQSIEEAIYSHIPMIGMPFFADQPINVRRLVSRGFGLSVDHEAIDKESLKNTILEVINNPKYRNNVKQLAELVLDQPMTGLERAVWWTEYVLRHKGAKHLRSPALDLPLYQYLLLDVIGFCLLVTAVIVYLFVIVVRLLFRLVKRLIPKPKVKEE